VIESPKIGIQLDSNIILKAKCKRDILVCMPTGYGKSLLFQLVALSSMGVTVVVMPLRSLIQD